MQDVGDDVARKAAEQGVGHHQRRRAEEGGDEADARCRVDDGREGEELGGGPGGGRERDDGGGKALGCSAEAVAQEVGEGDEAPLAQPAGKEQGNRDEAGGIGKRFGPGSGEALGGDLGGGGDEALGGEPGGEDRHADRARRKAPPGDQVVGVRACTAPDPDRKRDLEGDIGEDENECDGEGPLAAAMDREVLVSRAGTVCKGAGRSIVSRGASARACVR